MYNWNDAYHVLWKMYSNVALNVHYLPPEAIYQVCRHFAAIKCWSIVIQWKVMNILKSNLETEQFYSKAVWLLVAADVANKPHQT